MEQFSTKISNDSRKLLRIDKTSKRKPIIMAQAQSLKNTGIDVSSLQRTCYKYYNTRRVGTLLFLSSPFKLQGEMHPYKSVTLDFSEWHLSHRVYVKPNNELFDYEFVVDGNRDLFTKLLEHNLI